MAFEIVGFDARGRKAAVAMYRGKTRLALEAARKPATGSPVWAAMTPAVRFPRLPLGTQK